MRGDCAASPNRSCCSDRTPRSPLPDDAELLPGLAHAPAQRPPPGRNPATGRPQRRSSKTRPRRRHSAPTAATSSTSTRRSAPSRPPTSPTPPPASTSTSTSPRTTNSTNWRPPTSKTSRSPCPQGMIGQPLRRQRPRRLHPGPDRPHLRRGQTAGPLRRKPGQLPRRPPRSARSKSPRRSARPPASTGARSTSPQPYENPFGSLLGDLPGDRRPQTGVVAKLAGKVQADPPRVS